MSNLLKVGTTISKSERIIDYNDIIKDRVEAARAAKRQKADSDGFINGLNADVVERLPEDEIDTEAAASEEITQESAEAARAEAEEILAQAKAEAEEILAQAQAQAGQICEEAKKEGFNSGTIESERQLTEKKQELEQQHAQLVKQLEEDYEQRRNDMEPQIVEALLSVFTEVTHTVSEDNKEIVLHLINNVLKNVENSHSYSIKVSPDDYNFVLNNQGKIYCAMNNEVNLDIVQDMALKQNECMIETDSGVFNCSLDVELHNLIKQIKLLSCM